MMILLLPTLPCSLKQSHFIAEERNEGGSNWNWIKSFWVVNKSIFFFRRFSMHSFLFSSLCLMSVWENNGRCLVDCAQRDNGYSVDFAQLVPTLQHRCNREIKRTSEFRMSRRKGDITIVDYSLLLRFFPCFLFFFFLFCLTLPNNDRR